MNIVANGTYSNITRQKFVCPGFNKNYLKLTPYANGTRNTKMSGIKIKKKKRNQAGNSKSNTEV